MIVRLSLFVAAALAWPVPAAGEPNELGADVSAEAISAELTNFGQWMVRLREIEQPVQVAVSELGPRWQAAMQAGPGRGAEEFRPFIANVVATIDRTNVQLEALETPEIGLDLPAEIQPARLRADTLRINNELRSAIASFEPVLDALNRNDNQAAFSALDRVMQSLQLVMESRMLMARGMLAVTPREEATWEAQNIQYLFFRVASRVLSSWSHAMATTRDPSLSDDLLRLAEELETTADAGNRKAEEEALEWAELLDDAMAGGDRNQIDIVRRSEAVLRLERGYFPLGRQLADLLREQAAALHDRPMTIDAVRGLFRQMQLVRVQMEQIGRQSSAVLADAN